MLLSVRVQRQQNTGEHEPQQQVFINSTGAVGQEIIIITRIIIIQHVGCCSENLFSEFYQLAES